MKNKPGNKEVLKQLLGNHSNSALKIIWFVLNIIFIKRMKTIGIIGGLTWLFHGRLLPADQSADQCETGWGGSGKDHSVFRQFCGDKTVD